jgi:hypothetical protein
MADEFTYDCFLSYSSKDEDFAKLLQESLERNFFRLSKKIRGDRQRIYILRDKADVEGDEDIEKHFQKKIRVSRHLLVICSEAVKEHPNWVNKEIVFFNKLRKGERDTRKIVVVNYKLTEPITSGSFPTALIGENKEYPLAEDWKEFKGVHKKTFFRNNEIDTFQLKIFAQLLTVPLSEFIRRHQTYIRTQNLTRKLTVGFVLALIIVASYFINNSVEVVKSTEREKDLEKLYSWIEAIRAYKAVGITDIKRSADSALVYSEKYPRDKAFIEAKRQLDSLTKK